MVKDKYDGEFTYEVTPEVLSGGLSARDLLADSTVALVADHGLNFNLAVAVGYILASEKSPQSENCVLQAMRFLELYLREIA